MRAPLRWAIDVVAGTGLVLLALLGAWWATDRVHAWEQPRWSCESFELLPGSPRHEPGPRERWAVATNPRCRHCIAVAWRLYDAREREPWPAELVALIVDTPSRPGRRVLLPLPPVPMWWDRENRWREKWGHRLYGEVLQFDRRGRYLGTVPADRLTGPRAPADSTAPARNERGGT
jgi:hypothetical protein